jgi:homoserine dehydrogenase
MTLGYHAPMAGQPLRIAILGAGTVGREVVAALRVGWAPHGAGRAPEIARRSHDGRGRPHDGAGRAIQLAGVAVRDLARAEAAGIPAELLTDAPAHLLSEGSDVVVELMGGEEPARTLIAAALGAGMPVVTANKYVLARHGAELEAIARRTSTPLRFEAAVMGGTPILRLLAEDLAGTEVVGLRGIVNGTTNHILTEMATGGLSYEAALAGAQAAGYAEADPTGDVEGGDAADKLVILARLAFGTWLDRAAITVARPGGRPGITGVTANDLEAASKRGQAIRLLASVSRREPGGTIEATVLPTEVPKDSPLGGTSGVRNRLEVETDRLGWIGVDGPGAGGAATAAAVLADLAAIAAGSASTWGALPPAASAITGRVEAGTP